MGTLAKNDVPNIPLSQPLEDMQIVEIGNNLIVINARDLLQIGSQAAFGDDYSSKDNIYIYTEGLLLSSTFRFKKGVISTHSISIAGKGALDLSGKPGGSQDTPNQSTSKKGVKGGDGAVGGQLSLYIESVDVQSPLIHISAGGGAGGEGQQGTLSTLGGDGGNGGNGGHVVILNSLPYFAWFTKLKQIAQLKSLTGIQSALAEQLKSSPDVVLLTTFKETLVEATKATTIKDCLLALENASFELQGLIAEWNSSLLSTIDVSGGNYGVYGEGKMNGVNGEKGKPGTLQHVLFDQSKDVINKPFAPFLMIHPSQCTRLLEKIKLMYLTIDPVLKPQGVKDLFTLLLRLQARTEVFVNATETSELVQYYKKHEAEIGAIGAVAQLKYVNAQATQYIKQLGSGKDLFGYDSNHVPMASFAFYKDTLETLIDNFGKLQIEYNTYFEQLNKNKADSEQVKRARESLTDIKATAQNDLNALKHTVLKTATVIDSYQNILPTLKKKVTDAIKDLENDIQSYFDFNFDNLFQSLTTLAFVPDDVFMISTLASEFYYKATTKITNDKDIPVNKDYLVRQVKTVKTDIDSLVEGYQSLDNGLLSADDPAAGRLIATEKELFTFLNDFYGKFPKQLDELKKVFKQYISQVIARNNTILTYNASVLIMLRNHEMIKSADEQTKELNDEALDKLSPNLPDLVTFMSSIIYSARNQLMEVLDLTARAYRFWSLTDRNPLTKVYKSNKLPQINYAILLSIKNEIINDYQQAVERFGTNCSEFPRHPDDQGLILELPSYQVEMLQLVKEIIVPIAVVTPDITFKKDENNHIFAKMANVRVRYVRVWIDGAKTANNQLRVHITHKGEEKITNQIGDVFSFSHEPVNKPFIYHLDTNQVVEEANFGVEEGTSNYAALGPFTDWTITINEDDNDELDLTEVTGIRLEFHGTNYDFDNGKKTS